MYRPAFAVQARELTTQQTILQNQIEKMSDSMYKHGAMVIPGEVTYDLNHFSIKLTSSLEHYQISQARHLLVEHLV